MIMLLLFMLALIVLGVAAIRWGVDSTDKVDSKEWDRRWRQALR